MYILGERKSSLYHFRGIEGGLTEWRSLVQQELLASELRDPPALTSNRIADRHFYTHFLCGCKGPRLRLSF